MKEKIILLVDADADCARVVLEAAAQTGHGVRLSRDGAEALGFLNREFDRIDSLIVDVDPGSHGMALLSALCALWRRLPVIVLTALKESHVKPVVLGHGADACLGKPLSIERLSRVIDSLVLDENDQKISCDPWGHPCGRETEMENAVHA
jgi:DNA-binding response OmpR family regulator